MDSNFKARKDQHNLTIDPPEPTDHRHLVRRDIRAWGRLVGGGEKEYDGAWTVAYPADQPSLKLNFAAAATSRRV